MLGKETGTEHAPIRKLVELKAVDEAYPLVGIVELSPPQTLKQALADKGAVVARPCCGPQAYLLEIKRSWEK